jgi:hypothetical protein
MKTIEFWTIHSDGSFVDMPLRDEGERSLSRKTAKRKIPAFRKVIVGLHINAGDAIANPFS